VGKSIDVAIAGRLLEVDPRIVALRSPEGAGAEMAIADEATAVTLERFFECDVAELRGYQRYVREESPYSTHQGVKGSEFPRVLVVLDDEEGRHYQCSYDRSLGIKSPSKTDIDNLSAGKETIVERTRRLFYVCSSRATEALAVVLYARDVAGAVAALKGSGLPGAEQPVTLSELTTSTSDQARTSTLTLFEL
jgi:DNA helicase-2/ATP-dependent DNA helicase PcrA